MSKIIVIGSSNTDMVVKTNKFPVPGETILGGEFFMFSGGKGANQAVAAARMGSEVTLICKTGNDIFGQRAIEEFKKEGIITTYIGTDLQKASGTALILVDEKGENEIVVAPGANNVLTELDIEAANDAIENAELILLQLEIPVASVLYAAKKGFELGKKVILNPAPAQQLPGELFAYLYLVTPNETEAEILTGIKVTDRKTAADAAEKLLNMGVQNAIITMGAEGAFFKNKDLEMLVPSPKVNAVDTTAAGDVFNGVLASGITSGKDWQAAISTACKAASISVTRMGAQASMPYLHEVND
ncbi:MAG TPA: ribokinase [Panacibacter sp.]|nr:ribokinase [Panacibacter sp.]